MDWGVFQFQPVIIILSSPHSTIRVQSIDLLNFRMWGKLREVREVREKLRDKCPTSYGKRLLSLNFPNDRRE